MHSLRGLSFLTSLNDQKGKAIPSQDDADELMMMYVLFRTHFILPMFRASIITILPHFSIHDSQTKPIEKCF